MAFDGSVVAALTKEFNTRLSGARIAKIIQPETDELLLTFKGTSGQERLLISVNPSLPVIYLTDVNKTAPLTAPSFCMLLRKHLTSGKVISVTQPSMERIINFEIEHYNEMGDLCRKILTVELMGKHSNIIFRDGTKIIDSIRHVSALISSVREVLPGRDYFIPFGDEKMDPFTLDHDTFIQKVCSGSDPLFRSVYMNITGFSPRLAEEACYRSGIDGERSAASLNTDETESLFASIVQITGQIQSDKTDSYIVLNEHNVPEEFSVIDMKIDTGLTRKHCLDVSEMLYTYYSSKQSFTQMRQKTTALRQSISTILGRDNKKLDLQLRQIKDTEKKDKFKLYGELLTAYGYYIPAKSTSYKTIDFYTGNDVTIPLDPALSAIENGKKYFDKYAKLKRTRESLEVIIKETENEIAHLESILASLDTARNEADIADIRNEMAEAGYIKKNSSGKKVSKAVKSAPLHYISSDGFDMYVGKNNYQNELVTFKLAEGGDWWFHAKKRPGSHVIVKANGLELPDRTFEEAAKLAAFYSAAEGNGNIEIDYTQRKNIKKPGGSKPGFVIYHTNYSMSAVRDITGITEVV